MPKVFIVGGSHYQINKMFCDAGWEVISDHKQANLFVFTGGEDVSPHYYGEKKHKTVFNSPTRDAFEKVFFHIGVDNKIPMIGICRGGQFLNVMSGGKMYQHVNLHGNSHPITDVDTGMVVWASSTHHQMMRPASDALVVAIAKEGGWKEYCNKEEEYGHVTTRVSDEEEDTEVVYYAVTKSICFQPHPEFGGADLKELQDYFFLLINRFFNLSA